jgi:asparagine synthase (glutamine-hydrolysing)
MCGIAGIVDLGGRQVEPALLKRLCDHLAHRGPDTEGFHFMGVAALGHRRLSIIDLAAGRQPMGNEDGTVWVTFNGEIYNFHALRDRLEQLGHRFVTHCDTEVIVHAYEQYGPACVDHFRGMFAFAVWDEPNRTLFLARDRVGKKPLFYCRAGGQFVFASELQALLEHPDLRREPDLESLDDYLTYGYVPAPRTAFRNVWKLPPACRLTLRLPDGEPRVERYWRLDYRPKNRLSEVEAVEEVRERLTEAVRLRLIADVPLGVMLSGGIDSGLVLALAAGLTAEPVRTFSVGFDDKSFSELPHARQVARRYGAEHHELIVRPNGAEVLPLLVRRYGEPFADSSALPSYHVARLTRQHVKAVLNGDGGDECFGGYERYLGGALANGYRRLPALVRGCLATCARMIPNGLPRRSRIAQTKRFLGAAGLPASRQYLRWVCLLNSEQRGALYSEGMRAELSGRKAEDWLTERFAAVRRAGATGFDELLAVDVESYLPSDLLVKMDIATMANGLEARSPFLDHPLLEFAARLPTDFKLRGLTLKHLLRQVGRKLLPGKILRRRKMGFGAPVASWLRGDLRPLLEDVLLSARAGTRGYFRPEKVNQLVRQHLAGSEDHSASLWALLCLELWHREFLD